MTEQTSTSHAGAPRGDRPVTPSPSDGAPSVVVEPGAHASAGAPAVMRVHIRNLADGPRDMSVTVIGLDDGWAPEPVVLADVAADATVSAEAALVPVTGAMPGDYPFVVVVQALEAGAAQVVADRGAASDRGATAGQRDPAGPGAARGTTLVEAQLTVDAPSEVLLTVEPADSRMRLRRSVSVVLSNTGTAPVDVALSTRTDPGLRLELHTDQVTVPARTTVRLDARARNLRPQLMGHLSRRTFSVSALGHQAPARFSGTVTARPLLSSGFLRAMSLLLVVVLWAGGLVVGLPWVTQQMTADEPSPQASASPSAGDGGAGAPGSAGDGAGGDGADGAGGAGGDGAPAEQATVRIGGVVTATDPSGVRVQVSPASVVPAAEGTGGSGTGTLGSSIVVPVQARADALAAALAGDTPDDGPVGKTSRASRALESTTAVSTSRSTSTGEDGAWAFSGLSPNLTYLVTLSKAGYQTVRHVVSGAEAAAGLDVELLAGDGSLSGTVLGPDGARAGGVDIVITDGTTTVTTSTATTGAVGTWSVDGLSTPSTYLVTAQGNGLGAQSRLVALGAGGSASSDVTLSNGVATLSGLVSGPDALGFTAGIGGATVTASDGTTTRTASTVTSGIPGSFTLVDLPIPASYAITVEAPGFATQTLQLALDATTSRASLDVAMRTASGVVQGTVRSPSGAALTSAGVTLHNDSTTYKTMVTGDGTFRLNGVEPGEYVVSAAQFGHLTGYATVRASAGFATTVDLVLTEVEGDGLVSTSRIRGRVGDARTNGQLRCTGLAAGEPCLVTTTLTAQNPDGTTRSVSVTTNSNDEYLIPGSQDPGLLPGLYVLEMSASGYEPSTIRVTVPMDTTVTAGQVALFPSPSLTGTVLARVGSVPAGTCVVVLPGSATMPSAGCVEVLDPSSGVSTCSIDLPARCGLTGTNGGYTITNLASGTYSASVQSGDPEYVFSDDPTVISLAAGDVRRYDATLNRLARIAVTALINRGSATTPASNALVTPFLLVPGQPDRDMGQQAANAQGYVQLTTLPPGSYRFDVSSAATTELPDVLSGSIEGVSLAYNQELSTQIVLTNAARVFQGRLVTQLSASSVSGVERREVRVTGITGYVGSVPTLRTARVTSDDDGYFMTQDTNAGRADYLPVVSATVDVSIAGDSTYRAQSFQNVTVASTATQIHLEPAGMPFRGTVRLDGASLPAGNQVAAVRVEMLSSPPGAGAVAIAGVDTSSTTSVNGRLVWSDMTQPIDPSQPGGARLARPGEYSIRVSLAGFDPVVQDFTILPGGQIQVGLANVASVDVVLERFGNLRVAARVHTCTTTQPVECTPTTDGVVDPVVTLRGNGSQQTATAAPGQNSVDFGEIPSGTYSVSIQAAGYVGTEREIVVVAGQNPITTPAVVYLEKYASITGVVTTTVGTNTQRLAGAQVTATRIGADGQPVGASFTTVSDVTGTYRLSGTLAQQGLVAGQWKVQATLLGYADLTDVAVFQLDMGIEKNQPLVMVLSKVDFKVTVVKSLESGEGLNGLSVQLNNAGTNLRNPCTYVQDPADPTRSVPSRAGCEAVGFGEYLFQKVDPVQSTLDIDGTALGHARLSLLVAPVLGQSPWSVTVPLVSMTNTVRGVVSQQSGAGAPVPLAGASLTLAGALYGPVGQAVVSGAQGAFGFENLRDDTYTLTASADGFTTVVREFAVRSGQVAVLDVVMFRQTRQVEVVVTSGSGTDLSGTLVGLSATAAVSGSGFAAQPLVRQGDGTFSTSFNQVPTGTWTATLTGGAGHPWTTTAQAVVPTYVPSTTPDPGAPTIVVPVTVTEVVLTLSASGPSGGSDMLDVVVTGRAAGQVSDMTPVSVQVPVDSGTRTVSLLAGAYTVVGTTSGTSTVAPAGGFIVGSGERNRRLSFSLTQAPVATRTQVSSSLAQHKVGDTATFSVSVEATGVQGITGQATVTLGGVEIDTVTLVDGAGTTRSVVLTEEMLRTPTSPLSAVYAGRGVSPGSPELRSSTGTAAVSVQAAATTVLPTAPAGVAGSPVIISAVRTPLVAGTVSFALPAPLAPTTTCPPRAVAAGDNTAATCSATSQTAGTYQVQVTFTPTSALYATVSATVAVEVS